MYFTPTVYQHEQQVEYLSRREQFLIKYHAHRPQGSHHESCLRHRLRIELSLCGHSSWVSLLQELIFCFSKGHSRQSFPSVILFSGIKAVLSQSGLGDILLRAYLGCVSVCAHVLCTLSTGQRTTCRSRFSSSSMWVLQIELRSQVFTHQVTLCFFQITLATIYCVLSLLSPLFSTSYTIYCCLLASNKTS